MNCGRGSSIVDSIIEQAPVDTPGGRIPSDNVEVNGEMMQVLSRLRFMTGNDAYLDMACRIAERSRHFLEHHGAAAFGSD